MIRTQLVSSVEKCFLEEEIASFSPLSRATMLRNERLSVQLLHTNDADTGEMRTLCRLTLGGTLAPYATARTVDQVPVVMPEDPDHTDNGYLRHTPGLYPDILTPLHYGGCISVVRGRLQSVWIELDPNEALPGGMYELTVTLTAPNGAVVASHCVEIEILNASLPESEMIFTQWLHCDCLANYYRCEVWSEEHWQVVERFAAAAVRGGVNLLLTPIHTPPIDTAVGGERTTTQLVEVTVTNGEYHFDFSKLDRWIEMCDRVGVKYLEIAHFFTQWGAAHAPKIMATVDGEYRRIFGWETDATGEDYVRYLHAFLPAFLSHMKARGDDRRCFFHISDEPNASQLDSYRAAKQVVAELLDGYPIMDALSDFSCWGKGVVELPIPATDHIEPFIEAGVSGLWTYYCCCQGVDVSNRFIAMPLWRTRCIGMQFYRYDIVGFLHWGLNHYNNRFSVDHINPYGDVSGEYWVQAGDTHSLYPSEDGDALESIRFVAFHEGLQDVRAMKLAETYVGKARVVAEMEDALGSAIKFRNCVKDAATMQAIRDRVNDLIREGAQE